MTPDRAPNRQPHWFVYMLECENGSYYTGSTDDPARRYAEHRKGTSRAKYTRSFKPVRMARCWRISGARGIANRVERLIQGLTRKEKEAIVADPGLLAGMLRSRYGDDYGVALHDAAGPASAGENDGSIIEYVPAGGEWHIRNPYLEELLAFIEANRGPDAAALSGLLAEKRPDFICRYAFSIPTIGVIEEVAGRSPLVEIGAGNGYWAMCLRDAGADVVAYDRRPPGEEAPWEWREANQWFDDAWSHVDEGDESMAGRYPERALFLCWPPIYDPMAVNALRRYREAGGTMLIFIGGRGSTADEDFFRELEAMRLLVSRRIPSWPGVDEWLMIYEVG